MKYTRKALACVLSMIMSVTLILTGCAAQINTTDSQMITGAAAPTQEAVSQTPAAMPSASEQITYVSLDVNPSLKLTIQNGAVIDVAAYNDDGTKIVAETDVAGLSPEEAMKVYINAFALGGYITNEGEEASLVVTASGESGDELTASLKETAEQQIAELGLQCDVVVSAVTEDIADEAKASGLTPGRYLALSYLAGKEGITLDEAKAKYGSLKMGKLVKLLDDVDAVFGHRGDDKGMKKLIESGILTPEQIQIMEQAQGTFKTSMKQAQEVFKQARTQAKDLWKNAKDEIQNAFKSDKDTKAWKTAKDALKTQLEQQKRAATEAFKQAKTQAQVQFRAAIESLGLTDEQIAALIEWGFDADWFDFDWDDAKNSDTEDQPDSIQNEQKAGDDEDNKKDIDNNDTGKPAGNANGKDKGNKGNKK